MNATRQSLLARAQGGDEGAWSDLVRAYRPWLADWLAGRAIPRPDADDLVQEILLGVVQSLPAFRHSGRQGAFRAWLRTIARHAVADYWDGRRRAGPPAGAGGDPAAITALADPVATPDRSWDDEHDRYVLCCLLAAIDLEFEPTTVRAFRLVTLDGRSSDEAAAELGLTVGAVYAAKSRVLHRLRADARDLIEGAG